MRLFYLQSIYFITINNEALQLVYEIEIVYGESQLYYYQIYL